MASQSPHAPLMRKTRIVCISDTHNQTPKLPKGDVFIHAGDLTNQGSYTELKKTVDWIEKLEFEAKIVVAGNHELTLDAPFFAKYGATRKWPKPQDSDVCRRLFLDSPSITYLENEAATIYLNSPTGPHTCFKVFGSPCTPNMRTWAFKYKPEDAAQVWDKIPSDADVVITHTPPKNHGDSSSGGDMVGCEGLLKALQRVRPMLSVFGHVHEGRGAERVHWNTGINPLEGGCLEERSDAWADPGLGNNKLSLINLTAKGGQPLATHSALTRHCIVPSIPSRNGEEDPSVNSGGQPGIAQPSILQSTSRPQGVQATVAGDDSEARLRSRTLSGGAIEFRREHLASDVGPASAPNVEALDWSLQRLETVMINAAFKTGGNGAGFNKPIVVDIDLPIWVSKPP